MEVKVEIKLKNDGVFEANTSKVCFSIARDKEDLANPLEVFLSALGACLGIYALRYFKLHNIAFKSLKINLSAELSLEPPLRLTNIKARIFTDAHLEPNREVFLRFVSNCPIHNTILHTKEVEISLD